MQGAANGLDKVHDGTVHRQQQDPKRKVVEVEEGAQVVLLLVYMVENHCVQVMEEQLVQVVQQLFLDYHKVELLQHHGFGNCVDHELNSSPTKKNYHAIVLGFSTKIFVTINKEK